MVQYTRLARGLTNQVSELVPVNTNIYSKIKKYPNIDQYLSLYKYEDKHFEEFLRTNSVAGMHDIKTDRLLWDFDDGQAIENAQKDSKELCARLIESGVPEERIRAFFSGNKGFHIEVLLNENLNRQEFVNITFNMADGLPTFDVRINDEARVIRAPLTLHPKSKLFKIPLDMVQLNTWSIEDIKVHATEISTFIPRKYFDENEWRIDLPEPIGVLKTQTFKKVGPVELTNIKGFDVNDIDFLKCPRWMAKERYALQEGFFYGSESVGQGERNIAFMVLAATYRNQGFSPEHTLSLLEATAILQAKRTGETEYTPDQLQREVINVVYSPSWKGGIYPKDEPLLILTRERFNIKDLVHTENKALIKIEDVGTRFKTFAANFHENRILTGIESLDKKLVLTTGMAIGILGAPSSGKTTLLNKIIKFQSNKNIPCIYQSLDMSDNLLYLRMLQQHLKLPIETILDGFQQDKPPQNLLDAYNNVLKSYSNVHFNFRSAMTVDQIDRDVQRYKDETGLSPKFIAIDYLEKVRSDFSDPTASSGLIASQLSDLAKKHDACVAVLLQPQKAAGDPSQPLLSMRRVKGASQVEQDLRAIVTAWRPGFNPQDMSKDRFMSLAVVKNNLGELCQLDYEWSGINGEIKELNYNGRNELKQLLAEIAEKENAQKKDWDI